MDDIEFFDVISWLEDQGIDYITSGKNVSAGWVEVNCPFCGDDPSYHLGINLESKMINCWRCGTKGPVTKYIKEILGCSTAMANTIIARYSFKDINLLHSKSKRRKEPGDEIVWPPMYDCLLDPHREYLKNRGFIPSLLEEKYDLKSTAMTGDSWRWRIIVPIYLDGKIVSYTSRKIVEDGPGPRWRDCPSEKCIIPVKSTLYNIDNHNLGDPILLVEGPSDVWRVGNGAVGCYTSNLTDSQIQLLLQHKPSHVYIAFDGEEKAIRKAYEVAGKIGAFVPCSVIELPEGKDPATLSNDDLNELKKLLRR